MTGKLDIAVTPNQLKIDVLVRQRAALVVEHQIDLTEAQLVV